jgi:hypothetical protein
MSIVANRRNLQGGASSNEKVVEEQYVGIRVYTNKAMRPALVLYLYSAGHRLSLLRSNSPLT